jgi:hypothetical protein
MRDCPNATMRERLPDLMHDRLSAGERAEVHAHLNECADCRAELALLERVRSSMRPPEIDTRRILSALPAYRAMPSWRRYLSSPMLQAAAAIALLAGGALLFVDRRASVDESRSIAPIAVAPVTDTPTVVDSSRPATQRRSPRPEPQATELAVGELFEDLTDAELQALLDAFGSLEAVTPVETEVPAPAVNRAGT